MSSRPITPTKSINDFLLCGEILSSFEERNQSDCKYCPEDGRWSPGHCLHRRPPKTSSTSTKQHQTKRSELKWSVKNNLTSFSESLYLLFLNPSCLFQQIIVASVIRRHHIWYVNSILDDYGFRMWAFIQFLLWSQESRSEGSKQNE